MIHTMVIHKVADFDSWLPHFEKHAEKRKPQGCVGAEVFRSADDPNNVVIMFKWKDAESFKKFGETEDLKNTMQAAGVMNQPTMMILDNAGTYAG